ncbi:hypothetical protein FB451DRAFT_48371 [Mycena latifolia]|nr:hypothetical protein FB451DRAFT_48371 [Mycena latifolia]
MEHIHGLLYSIVNLYIKSETAGSVPPVMLDHIGKFTETLHKIHTFVEAQQDGNMIRHFFHQNEMSVLLKDCRAGLQKAMEAFKMDSNASMFNTIDEMKKNTEKMHFELLELISSLSDGTISDRSSSIYQMANGSRNSSNSFSMLPAKPKIFHGREWELEYLVKHLTQEPARIALLGGGGMGKTSLARAALHQPDIAAKYEHRFFVAADSSTTSLELAAQIGLHIGLEPGKNLTKAVVQYFFKMPVACLLVLDNLETPWEPMESRAQVEEFLSLLTEVSHLALIITMRGEERPAKVRWTHPFLPPLRPLSNDAALQTFIDIAEDFHDVEDVNRLLHLTDNMPLAVDLVAHLVDYEGCSSVLTRWETERTSLLSSGYDRRSSFDASIAISLSSPRITSLPSAKDLLSLLSILPDGFSDVELLQSNLAIQDVLKCKAVLLATSLAYNDDKKRLKSLIPIREHIQYVYPPPLHLIQPLRKYFHQLLDAYRKYVGVDQMVGKFNQINFNLGNLNQVLLRGLDADGPDLVDTINCTISYSSLSRLTGHGHPVLMDRIPAAFPKPSDHTLEATFIIEVFHSLLHQPIVNKEGLVAQAVSHFSHLNNPSLEAKFYSALGNHYLYKHDEISSALQFLEKSRMLASSCGDNTQHSIALNIIAVIKWKTGEYSAGQMHASEAQRYAKLSANLYEEARALQIEALCCHPLGDNQNSIVLLGRARKLLALCGMSGGHLDHQIMTTKAEVHMAKSEYAEARSIHTQIVQSLSVEPEPWNYAFSLLNLGQIDVPIGADKEVIQHNLDKAKAIFNTLGYLVGINYCEMISADLSLREGNISTAKALFQSCLKAAWGNDAQLVTYCLERLADVEVAGHK